MHQILISIWTKTRLHLFVRYSCEIKFVKIHKQMFLQELGIENKRTSTCERVVQDNIATGASVEFVPQLPDRPDSLVTEEK